MHSNGELEYLEYTRVLVYYTVAEVVVQECAKALLR